MVDNYERYRFQDFPWLDKDFDQAMEFLKEERERELGVFLQDKNVGPEKLEKLLELAKENGFLHALLLDKNQIGDDGCEMLAHYLQEDKKLRYLFLENNGITDKGLNSLLEGLAANDTLKSLWLGRNEISDDGVEKFSEYLLEFKNLKEFSVGGHRMTDDGAFCIARALNSNEKLVSVHLLDNQVDHEGARLLAEVASNHEACQTVEINGRISANEFSTMMGNLALQEQKAAFEQAVINGEEGPWLRSKIMVVGQGRAGKTATVRSMLNLPFNEHLESTIGAAISTSTTKKGKANKWEKNDGGGARVDLAVDAASRLAVLKMRKKKNDQKKAFDKNSLSEMRAYFKKMKEEEKRKIDAQTRAGANIIPKELQEEINQKFNATLVTNKNATLEDIEFTIWDYGGQRVFYTLHHLFLTKYGLYILAFDMRDVIVPQAKRTVEGYKLKKKKRRESKEYIEFWLNSVYMHAAEAPLIIVGTYLDVVNDTEDILEVNNFIQEILGERFKDVAVKNNSLCFFPLSNKECMRDIVQLARRTGGKGAAGGSNIDTIRDTIEEVARQQDFVNQNLSLRWIKCLDNLLDIDQDFVEYKRVIELAKGCGINEVQEVDNLLKFFHELGMIVHLDSTQHLRDIVTIKPQWLITELAKVIRDKRLHKFDRDELKKKGLVELYELVTEKSIVTRDWLEFLWPKDRVDFLIDLMKRTMLISDWKFGEYQRETAFLVPSLIENISEKADEEAAASLIQFQVKEVDEEAEIEELKKKGYFDDENAESGMSFGNILGIGKKFRGFGFRKKKNMEEVEISSLKVEDVEKLEEGADLPTTEVNGEVAEEGEGEEGEENAEKEEEKEEEKQPEGFYSKQEEVDSIVFDFSKSFLPNGVFQRLLCLCILKCTAENKAAEEPDLYKNHAAINMGNGQIFKLFQHQKQILCKVTKDHLQSYKVLSSMMDKLKADVMGKGLEWDVFFETVDLSDKTDDGVFHKFLPFDEVRENNISPWFHAETHDDEEELVHKQVGVDLEVFLDDIANF